MHRISRFLILLALSLLLTALPVHAQECPASVILALSRAYAVCSGAERNSLCYGSGSASITPHDGMTATFAQPGDVTEAGAASALTLTSDAANWSAVIIRTQANLASAEARSVTLFLTGNATLINRVAPLPTVILSARGTANVRSAPAADAPILDRVRIGGVLVANGQSEEGAWLRATIPNTDITGWVSAEIVNPQGDIGTLVLVDVDTPVQQPFDDVILTTALNDAPCAGTAGSGALIQTPNDTDEVRLRVNGALLRLTGTAWVQAAPDAAFSIFVLDGVAWLEAMGAVEPVPAGARGGVPLDADGLANGAPFPAAPYAFADVQFAPVNFLNNRVLVPQPLTDDGLTTTLAALTAPPPTPTVPAPTPVVCRYIVVGEQNVRTGPGEVFPVAYVLEPGEEIRPQAQTIGDDGRLWLQVNNRRWLYAAGVEATGPCGTLPESPFVLDERYNTFNLDTCRPLNGPLRAGQVVTFEFVPNVWRIPEESEQATQRDRGRVFVNEDRLRVVVSEPIKVGELRYIRTFAADWMARPGSYRVEGSHLAYERICNITVPLD